MRLFPILILGALVSGAMSAKPALAGGDRDGPRVYVPFEQHPGYQKGRYTPTRYSPWDGNHPYAWNYPSTYPWATPVTYHAGPGNYYPARHARMKQIRRGHRWTGYPPRHFYVTDYNGYAPQYGFYPQY